MSAAPPRVLIVEDDAGIAEVLELALAREGYRLEVTRDGPAGLAAAAARPPDLVILDWMLPGADGLEVCRRLRRRGDVPILMLTARDQEVDKVRGLETGADDYVTKPFALGELRARVRALLRRARGGAAGGGADAGTLAGGPVCLDPGRRRVTVRGAEVTLTATEFSLLEFLMRHPGQVFSRDQLLARVWGYDHAGYGRTVDSHMTRLRKKVEVDPRRPDWLVTVRGFGYKFAAGGPTDV